MTSSVRLQDDGSVWGYQRTGPDSASVSQWWSHQIFQQCLQRYIDALINCRCPTWIFLLLDATEVDFAASASLQIHFFRVSPLLMGGLKEWRSGFADFLSYTQQQSQFLTSRLKPAGSHLLDQQGQEQWFPTGGLRAKSGSKNRSGGVANSWAKKLT